MVGQWLRQDSKLHGRCENSLHRRILCCVSCQTGGKYIFKHCMVMNWWVVWLFFAANIFDDPSKWYSTCGVWRFHGDPAPLAGNNIFRPCMGMNGWVVWMFFAANILMTYQNCTEFVEFHQGAVIIYGRGVVQIGGGKFLVKGVRVHAISPDLQRPPPLP